MLGAFLCALAIIRFAPVLGVVGTVMAGPFAALLAIVGGNAIRRTVGLRCRYRATQLHEDRVERGSTSATTFSAPIPRSANAPAQRDASACNSA